MPMQPIRQRLARWLSPRQQQVVAACLVVWILYLLAGVFIVPRILASQIRGQARTRLDRDATVERVRFNPFTLTATVEGLRLADRDEADLVTVERLRANLQLSGVFRWAWRFKEISIERPVVSARLLADGRPSIADLMEPSSEPAEPPGEPAGLPRLIVDRFILTGGAVQFSDASRQPEYRSRFEPLELDITDLITIPREGGEHVIAVGIGSGAELRWRGQQTVEPLRFTGTLDITGLSLPGLWDYVGADHVLAVPGGRADIALPYEIVRGEDGRFQASLSGASAVVRDLSVRARNDTVEWLAVPEVRASGVGASWPAARLEVDRVQIVRPRALARLEEDGAFNWTRAAPPETAEPTAGDGGAAWDVRIASVEIEGGSVGFEDVREPDVRIDASDLVVRAGAITSDLAAPIAFEMNGRVQENGAFQAGGSLAMSPLAGDVTFDVSGIDIVPFRPYVAILPGADIQSGVAALKGSASISENGSAVSATADGSLNGVELLSRQGERLLAWEGMAIEGITVDRPPDRARVRRVILDRPFANILIDPEGRLNLTTLTTSASGRAAAPARSTATTRVEVGTVEVRDGSALFVDQSMVLPFQAQIHSAGGTIRDISSFAAAPATMAIEGRVDETGFVRADGTLRVADPMASSEIALEFRSIEMLGLTPYFAEFAGYAVRSGVLDLDVNYVVKDRRLVGNHAVIARDLVLGERVQDSKIPAPGFAVRLAVALLKDREGRINMDVPIEGDVDSPEFAYRQVFWNAVRTIMRNAALAPFRALGRLFGRDEDDLELVEFDPGRSDLLPAEQDTLARLAEQFGPRAELTLAVEGRFDPESDRDAMRRAKLEALIDSRREAAAKVAAAADGSSLETILEALFTEQFSAAALAEERQRFTKALPETVPAAPPVPVADGEAAAAPPAPAGVLDAAGFYESLRAKLLEAQQVTQEELAALGAARASSIVAALTASGVVDPSRVTTGDSVPVSRRRAGSTRIASEMTMTAAD